MNYIAKKLVEECEELSIRLRVKNGQMMYRCPQGALKPCFKAVLKSNKQALIDYLTRPKLVVSNVSLDSSRSKLRHFSVVVDDRKITVLAPPGESDTRVIKSITDRFGASRISSVLKIND